MATVIAAADDPMFGLFRVIQDDGTMSDEHRARIDDALLSRMYRSMRLLRALDERMLVIQRQGRIGFYGEVKGQEATPIATGLALEADDWIFPRCARARRCWCGGFPSRRTSRSASATRVT
jgi:pyruvate dehydrogenase E1 component alpha subunit